MEMKRAYEKPTLRAVRLDVRAAVLGTCNTSSTIDPAAGVLTCVQVGPTCIIP